MKKRQFVDHIRIFCRAGNGGNGSAHFNREKYVPKGGPDGGDGGDGGDVILEVSDNTDNLTHFFFNAKLLAGHGAGGSGQQKTGKSGVDKVAYVPPGTLIYSGEGVEGHVREPSEECELVADLTKLGDRFVISKGGIGGKGNVRFKSSTNRAPQEAQEGTPGEFGYFFLELRKIADAGLVGFPNAGKSTLLSKISEAKPKVAAYPFTTLQPKVGVVDFKGFSRATVADIPGLIEGAHKNVGLGHDFLRHIMRCRLLMFVVDIAGSEGREPIEDISKLRTEISKYNEELAARPWLIVANKMDLEDAEEKLGYLKARFPKIEVIPISALEDEGIDGLRTRLGELIGRRPE